MITAHAFNAANGVQLVRIPGGTSTPTQVQIVLDDYTQPMVGAVSVEYTLAGRDAWQVLTAAQELPFTDGIAAFESPQGACAYRLTFAALAAPTPARIWLTALEFQSRAFVVQNHTEANVKVGSQFEFATHAPVLAAGAALEYVVATGDLPVAIKGRILQFDGLGVRLETYRDPTYTGGTVLDYFGLNFKNQNVGVGQIIGAPAVTDNGTKVASDKTLIGSNLNGQSTEAIVGTEVPGLETILAPNSTYLFRTVSIDSESQRLSTFATWYEGLLDLPL